jgi:protein-S-isoprenylcysteine O-methyltransferase Ste14
LIPLRDLLLLAGYKPAVARGYSFEVNLLGKAATWLLYASLGFTMVTDQGTAWPRIMFWIGFGLAIAALVAYVWKARSVVKT